MKTSECTESKQQRRKQNCFWFAPNSSSLSFKDHQIRRQVPSGLVLFSSQPWNNIALTAVKRFVWAIPTVINRVTLPPERDTLIGPAAELQSKNKSQRECLTHLVPAFFKVKVIHNIRNTQPLPQTYSTCQKRKTCTVKTFTRIENKAIHNNMITLRSRRGWNGADLTGGAVGEAGLIVSSQVKICRTGAFVPPTRRQKTQVATSSICNLTLVLGYWGGQ